MNYLGVVDSPQFRATEKIKWPIRLKITLPFLFLALAVATGVTILFWRIVLENVDERFNNQLYEAGRLTADAIASIESNQAESIRLFANTAGVAEALRSKDAEEVRRLVMGAVVNNQVQAVEFIDTSGALVLAIRQRQNTETISYEYVQDGLPVFAAWPIVQKALESQPGDFQKYASFVQTDWGSYFYVAGPVRNSAQEITGVTLVGLPVSALARMLREATLAQVTLYDFEGQPISTSFPTTGYTQPLDRSLIDEILTKQDISSFRRDASSRDISGKDLDYGEILGPWETNNGEDIGLVGSALVKNVLITATLPSRILTISLVFLTVLLIILIGFNLSTVITRPLVHLMKATQSVASGDLEVHVAKESNDEIAVLADSFNVMIQNLTQTHQEMVSNYDSTLEGWVKILEIRDKETSGHSQRVVELTMAIADVMGIPEDRKVTLHRGALLHDIGKLGIPDSILLKNGPLTPEEMKIMRKHPAYAYEMLRNIPYLAQASVIPFCHHEWWNGNGYPRQLIGESIPLEARVFAIVDAWDALTTDRPYRKRVTPGEALDVIIGESGRQFDPRLVEIFAHYIETNFLGGKVTI
ncbi:HD domain-containing phosphohydrolase [Longilinea arvoryzae]|nr:HD domain-containing phosphohydrolase [Longilinea arvoryzae]